MKKHPLDYARQQTERLIQERFSCSLMSDAKWVRLLNALIEIGECIKQCEVKLVWDKDIRQMYVDEYTHYQFDYYDHAVEALISGDPKGWYDYKEIEWIRFNARDHELGAILRRIQSAGQFAISRSAEHLTLYAYQ